MASVQTYSEIKSGLQGQFGGAYPVLDFDDIEPALEQGTAPFIAIEEVVQNEEGNGFGDPSQICQREEGVIVIHFFVPAPESSGTARGLAESVQDFMRYRTFTQVTVFSVSPPDVEMMNNGLWTAAAIALTYHRDFHVAIP